VKDGAHPVEDVAQLIADEVPFEEDGVEAGEVLAPAGRQVVQHADRLALGEQAPHEVRADEAGTAGHEHGHQARSSIDELAVPELEHDERP